MRPDSWHLPWGRETTPHALLDVIRGCNISCQACYNARPAAIKPLADIEAELDALMKLRRLDSVSVVGGEVLLHPRLCEIVRLIKARGLYAELFTNGLLLDDRLLDDLKRAGTDLIFLHIDRAQKRPDMPLASGPETVRELWQTKTALVARHGIDAGLAMTAFQEKLPDVREVVEFVLNAPHVHYLLVTLFRDVSRMESITGGLDTGLRGVRCDRGSRRTDTLTNNQVSRYLQEELGLRPFCRLGSNRDPDDPRWLSYLVATRHSRDGLVRRHPLRVSAFEKLFMALAIRLSGRYPMYRPPHTGRFLAQVLLNGLLGGDCLGNFAFLAGLLRPGESRPGAKRLLVQCPADIDPDGVVVHCRHCPDAVLKNGQLVPVCIVDQVTG